MRLAGVGRGSGLSSAGAAVPVAVGNRVLYRRGGVVEWYRNGPLGLEQGFTLPRRLAGSGGPLRLSLAVGGGLRPVLARDGVVFQGPGGAAVLRYRGLLATDARGVRLPAWSSLRSGRVEVQVGDRSARYPLRIDPFIQQGERLAGTGSVGPCCTKQGFSVALASDGNTALIGGPGDNGNTGAAWVFTRSGSNWSQQGPKLVATDEVGGAKFGYSVTLSSDGSTALIGGPTDNNYTGAAWLFARSGSTWSQQGSKLTANDGTSNGTFGSSLALSGDGNTAVIGGPGECCAKPGAAWVFTRSGSTWSQQGSKLTANDEAGGADFGYSVALSGDGSSVLIGGLRDMNSSGGAAWVFTRSGSMWSQQGPKLVGTGAAGTAQQGSSVALSGDGNTALVGGPIDNYPVVRGAAWVFTRSGSNWSQQGPKLVATDEVGGAKFGYSVALSPDGSTALIGGPSDNNYTGAAWVFARSGSTWSQQGSKLAGTGSIGTDQGGSVALSGDGSTVLIGGPSSDGGEGAAWAFVRVPVKVTALSPNAGSVAGGNTVTIIGEQFAPGATVKFGATGAVLPTTYVSDKQLRVSAPAHAAGTAHVFVSTSAGTSGAWHDDLYAFGPATVTGVSPNAGPVTGFRTVTITGHEFVPGATVKFGASGAELPTRFVSDTQLQVTTPRHAAGTVAVFVSTPAGISSSSDADSYVFGSPTVSGVSANAGPEAGGNTVTITGERFAPGATVNFGPGAGIPATFVSDTQLRVSAPGHAAGTVHVFVSTPAGSSYFTDADLYAYGAPTVSGVSANAGPEAGGNTVTITGERFVPGAAAQFGASGAVLPVTFISDTQLQVSAPAHGAGSVDVFVSTAAGTSAATSLDQYTYYTAPTVGSFTPASGITGSEVTINGSYFAPGATVTFGALASPTVTVASGTQLTAVVPNGAVPGRIAVSTPGGTATSSASFTPTLSITSLSPGGGPAGTVVLITGAGFNSTSAVTFNGTTSSTVSYLSSRELKATAPAGATTGSISVTNSTGVVGTVTSAAYYADAPPTITSFTPGSGITGSTVTINGTDFVPDSSVKFGTLSSPSVTFVSVTQLRAIVPNGAVPGHIAVTTPAGAATSSASFTPTFSITRIKPAGGPPGTIVSIAGVGFGGCCYGIVRFGATKANVNAASPNRLDVTVPAGATTGPITVTNTFGPTGTVTSAAYYAVAPPTITSFSPATGITGSTVTINGTDFVPGAGVKFGALPAEKVTFVSTTKLTAVVPNGAVPGPITVATPAGTGTSPTSFTPTLSITAISPTSGAAGTVVTITGVGFNSTSGVIFNRTTAATVNHDSATQLTATAPAGATTGPIQVINTSGVTGTVRTAASYTVP